MRRPLLGLRLFAAAFLTASAALSVAASSASSAGSTVKVWFLEGEQLTAVDRPGSTVRDAIAALLAGPTAAEAKRGVRSYVPAGTPLRDVTVENGLATVDLGEKFVQGRDAASLLARLSQVVFTASGPEGATKVQLKIKGGLPLGLFPGAVTARPITRKYLETPNVPVPQPPSEVKTPVSGTLRSQQERLAQLAFLLPSDVDGQNGPVTQVGVLAFQKWLGLDRVGVIGPATTAALETASYPQPITRQGKGKRAEVLLDRQVVLAIVDDRVVRVMHVSTGAPATPTPPGDYKVYSKIARWWSVPFREWLPWALPFNGGIAFHELAEVPPYAASHGCVREFSANAKWMYDFGYVGMPVKVIARST